jgi:hypothetical protein
MTLKPSRTGKSAKAQTQADTQPAQRLRMNFAAVRVSFTWLGVRKTLNAEQKSQAAESFGAEEQYLSAAKKLLDTKHPAFAAVTSLRSQIIAYWKSLSLPYPEPGVRLIKQGEIESFNQQLTQYRQTLADAVNNLDQHYEALKDTARSQLGSLYNPADYPASLEGLFAVEWDFPSVEPPEYLLRLNPTLYQQETARISASWWCRKMAPPALSIANCWTLPLWVRSRFAGPAMLNRMKTVTGGRIYRRWRARCSGRSSGARMHWRRRQSGWRAMSSINAEVRHCASTTLH